MSDEGLAGAEFPVNPEDLRRRLEEQAFTLCRQATEATLRERELRADCLLDAADFASTSEALTRHLAETRRTRALLAHVERAIGRLQDNSYGYCLRCGEEIEEERLQAFPHVENCLRCETRRRAHSS
ncbi:TraR/DksA C4-type zinc finger protein [Streptomyces sp. NPDC096538]|uniref:TraR/DksA family transcriptional regulator n=1 Tax=Streptomyces sp. NPDC096538 TaxID=3155427 RepID=UPI0033256CC4